MKIISTLAALLLLLATSAVAATAPPSPNLGPSTTLNGVPFAPSATSDTTNANNITSGTINRPLRDYISVKDKGAKGDGTTDDTAAIVTAIGSVPANGTLYFPCGDYKLSGSAAEAFLLTKAINVLGAGKCVSFVGSLGASTDLFHIRPGTGSVLRGFRFSGLNIALTGGAHQLHFDSNASATSEMAEVEVDHILSSTVSGHFVYIDNPVSNGNGGTFNVNVHDNVVFAAAGTSGVQFLNAGDTIRVRDNILSGAGYAVNGSQIAGAGQLVVEGNNVTAFGGIAFSGGTKPIIRDNEFEIAGPNTATNGFMLGLIGVDGGTIADNQIQSLSGAVLGENIFIGAGSSNVVIEGNRISTSATSVVGVDVATGVTGLHIACSNSFAGFGAANVFGTLTGVSQCNEVTYYGAKCDGATDDGPAFSAALAAVRVVTVPIDGCANAYLINTTVNVPVNRSLIGGGPSSPALTGDILTTADVDTFSFTGGVVTMRNLHLSHSGITGKIINGHQQGGIQLTNVGLSATNAGSTDSMIYTGGSNNSFINLSLTNNRSQFSYAFELNRTSGAIAINNSVTGGIMGGTGSGFLIHSSDASGRPEGFLLNGMTMFGQAIGMEIRSCLLCTIQASTFDIGGNGYQLLLQPEATGTGNGVSNLTVSGNWFSLENSSISGVCINELDTHSQPVEDVVISGNHFYGCGYGVAFTPFANGVSMSGNTFDTIGTTGFSFNQSKNVSITGNTMRNFANNYAYLVDGASGGPFSMQGNVADGSATAASVITMTAPSKFAISGNPGMGTLFNPGVSCSGTPTSSFAANAQGIVTHC